MTTPLTIEPLPGDAGFRVAGELDASNAKELARRIEELRAAGPVLDLTGLEFIDSAGLNLLITTARGLEEGNRVTLRVRPAGPVRRVIDLMGFEAVLERIVVETVPAPAEGPGAAT